MGCNYNDWLALHRRRQCNVLQSHRKVVTTHFQPKCTRSVTIPREAGDEAEACRRNKLPTSRQRGETGKAYLFNFWYENFLGAVDTPFVLEPSDGMGFMSVRTFARVNRRLIVLRLAGPFGNGRHGRRSANTILPLAFRRRLGLRSRGFRVNDNDFGRPAILVEIRFLV